MKLAIYGAQGYALSTYEAIKTLYPKREILCFLVTKMGKNASVLSGLPVKELAFFSSQLSDDERSGVEIIIATPENVQAEIKEGLNACGFYNCVRMTSKRWEELMKIYHARLGVFLPIEGLAVGSTKPSVRIFVARSHNDKPINMDAFCVTEGRDHMITIQVGAALTDGKLCELTDDLGDNISHKNANYCELTGLYWIWKNALEGRDHTENNPEYFGLAQYRRRFEFSDDDLYRLADNDVDVVLPYPLMYDPDINAHHERYIKTADWEALLSVLGTLYPEYAAVLPEFLEQRYLYNYNVLLAKKSVLNDYCDWLFTLLEAIEKTSVPRGCERSDRYLGYMAEILETLYFMKNADVLNIVHKGCRMYV